MYKLMNKYNTRQKHQLHGTRPTCKSVVHSFSTRSSQIWNAMSNIIDSHNSLFYFKYKIKAFLLNNELINRDKRFVKIVNTKNK